MMMKKSRVRWSWKWVVLWSLWAARLVRQPTPALTVSSGLLRGSIAHDGTYRHYLGIPYATVGPEHRFKEPDPEPKWPGVFEAVEEYIHCYQRSTDTLITGQHDCLVLNVYTPANATPDQSLPVMVFIHGGGYCFGSAARFLYGPDYLVAKNVILVTFNYRVYVEGFLCLRTPDAPGNAAMKDQVAALKWVQRNIRAFGGDPDNVTLFGESAGAASVSLHLLSPMSKGLFHKAIAQSGSAISPWVIQTNPIYSASRLAQALGRVTEDPYELYNIFMNKTETELLAAQVPRPEGETMFAELPFVPCVEREIEGRQAFLTELPYNIFSSGNYSKVPMIIGSNSEEGYFMTLLENEKSVSQVDFRKALPKDLVFPSDQHREDVGDEVKQLYMGDKEVNWENLIPYTRYLGEPFFNYPSIEETELILKTSDQPLYSYFFTYDGWRNVVKLRLRFPILLAPGASHADDLMYMFKPCMLPSMFEDKMIDRITTLWTNFAKYGVPDGNQWAPTILDDPRKQVLGTTQTIPLWHSETLLYWRALYKKYRRLSYS